MRDGLVEAMAAAIDPFLVHPLEAPAAGAAALDAAVGYLSEHAVPLYKMGGLSPSYVVDDDPDEDTIWVVDLAVLREDT